MTQRPAYLAGTSEQSISDYTDAYFTNVRKIIEGEGDDPIVTYAAFIRRPVLAAYEPAVEWLKAVAKEQGFKISIETNYQEGDEVGAGDPILFFSGSYSKLSELETQFLQKLGLACTAAYEAKELCLTDPSKPFMDMSGRHNPGKEATEFMAYAAKVGSDAAKKENTKVKGFIGTSNGAGMRKFFGGKKGLGTMPHAFVGYAKYLLKKRGLTDEFNVLAYAAKLYRQYHPEKKFILLNDYDGKEVTDALEVCKAFPEEAASGELMFRLDTHGGRYLEDLDRKKSYEILERNAPKKLRKKWTESQIEKLTGHGVTAAAIYHFREQLDAAGYPNVKIVGSSGFNQEKVALFREFNVPVDMIGTGSFGPKTIKETYATADIIAYGDFESIKVGREHLIEQSKKNRNNRPVFQL